MATIGKKAGSRSASKKKAPKEHKAPREKKARVSALIPCDPPSIVQLC